MKHRSTLWVLALAALLTACGGGSSSVAPQVQDATRVPFADFVRARFAETADDTDPTSLEGLVFTDLPIDDPTAFDDLLDGGTPVRGGR